MHSFQQQEFAPCVWPEETAPPEAADCRNCELCRQRKRVVWGEGNPQAPVVVLLDNPGAREDAEGQAYVCGTRQMLQRAAYEAGLGMNDLYVTYLLKCRPVRAYDKPTARSACLLHLLGQIGQKKPRLLFCLGDTAVRQWFGDGTADVKSLRGAWHAARGYPTVVSYHPLAVRRRPNLYRLFLEDWRMVAARYRGESKSNIRESPGHPGDPPII